ncbi:MAG: hypothetical protein QM750_31430 [Rubrivivax sp.]
MSFPCILDVEASGFGRGSYPIEVGYALADGRTRCTLIRPPQHWTHWDESAGQVHRISREMLLRHGRAPQDVALMLNEDLAGQTVYCDGWGHDYSWLAALFDEAGLPPGFRLESVRRLLDEARLALLPELQRQALQRLGVARHRASNDARALQIAIGLAAGDELSG